MIASSAGTYSDEAQQLTSDNIPCDPCPNNRYTIDVGADAESDCLGRSYQAFEAFIVLPEA